MSKFERRLRLWMAGFGVTEDQADKICADPRIAQSIKSEDPGGMIQDLDGVLFRHADQEILKAFATPAEKLFLFAALS